MMSQEKKKLLAEAIRYLTLALIGSKGKSRELIEKALECLGKVQA